MVVALGMLAACSAAPAHNDAGLPPAAVVEAPASLTLVEGDQGSFVVTLAQRPSEPVMIDVASLEEGTAAVTTSSITLSPATYTTGALVTVTGGEDDDDVVNDTTEIELSIDGEVLARVATTVVDNDVQQIVVGPPNLTIGESATAALDVRLTREPAGPVMVTVSSSADDIALPNPTSLMFGPSDYAVAQTVSVSAAADEDTADDTATITVGQVPETAAELVQVHVVDDDVQALVIDTTSVPVAEGQTAAFTVALAFDPVTPVILQLQSSDPAAVTLPETAVRFDSTSYNVPQTVTVAGAEDGNTTNEMVTVSISGPLAADVTVPVTDNDDILVGTSQMSMSEGRTASFSVRLANDPGPNGRTVNVEVISGDVVPQQTTLTFTSADYATLQHVVVYAPVDASSTSNKSAAVRVSYPGQTPRDIAVTIGNRPGAGMLSALSLQHETRVTGAVGWMEVTFTVDTMLPGDGRVVIELPSALDASAAALLTTTFDGTVSVTPTPAGLVLVRSGGTAVYDGTSTTVRIGNIRNPAAPGDYPVGVNTETSSGDALDTGTVTDRIGQGPLVDAVVTLATLQPGATGNMTIAFTTTDAWPADGALEIYFPSGFDVAGVNVVGQTGLDGTLAAAVSAPSRVRLTRSGGTLLSGGSSVTITVGNVKNPATAQATTVFELFTQIATGHPIDVGFPDGVTIGCPATITRSPHDTYTAPLGGDAWYVYGAGTGYIAKLESSDWLVHHDFRFMMPAGATIAGIRFDIPRESTGWPAVDSAVRVVKTGIGQADRSSATQWQFSETAFYGGATDRWGETWTAADIESSTFGVAIAAKAVTAGMTGTVNIENVTATIYLSCP